MTETNRAAWIPEAKTRPFKIDDAPMPVPEADEVLVRNRAVAINPVDWAFQIMALYPVNYPYIEGVDAAGEVISVGSAVENFKVGDRVVVFCNPVGNAIQRSAFQLFFSAKEMYVAKIPDHISFAEASVLPLGFGTAASAIFQKDTLGLPPPQIDATPQNKVVLVWGGASSVGACAIQMIKAAGFDVAATASSKNLEHMKSIGAKYVFDYTKDSIVEDILSELKGLESAGVFCAIGQQPDVVSKCGQIADALGGHKFVSTVLPSTAPLTQGLPDGVQTSNVWGSSIYADEAGPAVCGKWLPAALADGSMKCAPPPLIFGQGLEAIQGACDRWREGVSYQKVVVELP